MPRDLAEADYAGDPAVRAAFQRCAGPVARQDGRIDAPWPPIRTDGTSRL
ncbi:MAG: hypothetical protein IPQ15_05500 [Betaproteobacteria bacterium]|nr:hypothetical protein [Betaproteobacteria bacterium]